MPQRSVFYVFALLLCFLASACAVRNGGGVAGGLPPLATDSAGVQLSQRIDEFLTSLAPQTFNGAVVVEKGGELILGNGYGYARYDQHLPFTTATLSSTGQLVQQFTAAAVIKLEKQGFLKLQDSLGRFLPDLPAAKRGIRIEQLLLHTSGLPQELPSGKTISKKKDFLEAIASVALISAPGENYLFSEAGYRLLAAVVEAASGQPYEVFVQQALLQPAGMNNTGYVLPEFKDVVAAKEKRGDKSVKDLAEQYRKADGELWNISGSSGMLSTLEDIFRWERMLQKDNLLPPVHMDKVSSYFADLPAGVSVMGRELNKDVFGTTVLQHNSYDGSLGCQILYFPEEELTVALLANQLNGQVEQLGMQIARIVLRQNYFPAPLPYTDEKFVRVPQSEEARYARSLLSFVQGNSSTVPDQIVNEAYNPAFKSSEKAHIHISALGKLRQRLKNASLEKAQQAWPQYMFTFFEPEGSTWYLLRVNVESQAPYRITGIGLETVDALNARW